MNLSTLAIFSTRYAVTRNGSADYAQTMALNSIWDKLSKAGKNQVLDEIGHTIELNPFDVDLTYWKEFYYSKVITIKDNK